MPSLVGGPGEEQCVFISVLAISLWMLSLSSSCLVPQALVHKGSYSCPKPALLCVSSAWLSMEGEEVLPHNNSCSWGPVGAARGFGMREIHSILLAAKYLFFLNKNVLEKESNL